MNERKAGLAVTLAAVLTTPVATGAPAYAETDAPSDADPLQSVDADKKLVNLKQAIAQAQPAIAETTPTLEFSPQGQETAPRQTVTQTSGGHVVPTISSDPVPSDPVPAIPSPAVAPVAPLAAPPVSPPANVLPTPFPPSATPTVETSPGVEFSGKTQSRQQTTRAQTARKSNRATTRRYRTRRPNATRAVSTTVKKKPVTVANPVQTKALAKQSLPPQAIAVAPSTVSPIVAAPVAPPSQAQLLIAPPPQTVAFAPGQTDPAIAQGMVGEQLLQQKLQQLEQQQQQLRQELNTLQQQRSQVNQQTNIQITRQNSTVQPRPQGIQLSAGPVFLTPRSSIPMDYAFVAPGDALAVSGDLAKVEYDQSTGVRFGLSYQSAGQWDIAANHTRLNNEVSDSVVAPTTPGGTLFTTRVHPFQQDQANTANATAKLDYNNTNAEFGYTIPTGGKLNMRVFGGLQATNVDQRMTANYDGRDFINGQVNLKDKFSGVGPRLGLEAKLPLGAGFSVFGRGAGSVMVGKLTSTIRETNDNGNELVANLDNSQSGHTVPALELAVGVGWEKQVGKNVAINLSGGYEYQQLFNVGSSYQFVDGQNPGAFSRSDRDLSLRGFFLQGGVKVTF